ncbi:O-antigen polysaccharide polymerase Wzy [Bacillus cytotoxicus]|uniref:O-antigen polysaccharide polymerase Wzy n=1 Tax=Bacillus cytotoxicus TaxID=580165 RepID=UPI0035C9AFAD
MSDNQYIKKEKSKENNVGIGSITILLAILVYLLYLATLSLGSTVKEYNEIIFGLSWLGIFLGVYVVMTWYKVSGTIFSPYTIFMLFFFLFNFGQCFMWAVGIHNPSEIGKVPMFTGFGTPSDIDIVHAQGLTLACILMFHSGAVLCYKNRTKKDTEKIKDSSDIFEGYNKKVLNSIFYVCLVISLVVIPIQLYDSYSDFQLASIYGYKSLYYSDFAKTDATFLGLLQRMFFPCLIGLLIGSRYNKKVQLVIYTIFIIYLSLNLLAGDRGSWLYKIIILIWLSHVCYKPIKFKKFVKYMIFSIGFLYIIAAIVSIRDMGLSNVSIEQVFQLISFEESPIIEAIFEMGDSMKPAIVLQKYGWDVWPYANTYLLAVLGMVTNKVIYFLDLPFTLPSAWFSQHYLGLSWGAGFSIVAEALLNAGPFFAPLVLIVIGYLVTSMIYVDDTMNYKKRPFKFFFVAATLHYFIPMTRNELHVQLKDWFYGLLILCIFILILKNLLFRLSHNGVNIRK